MESPTQVQVAMERIGFWLMQTGGGCTAYQSTTADQKSYYLVTAEGGCEAPEFWNEGVMVGKYSMATGEQEGPVDWFASLEEAYATLGSL